MEQPATVRAVAAARSIATRSGLDADQIVVLHDSNKLTLRLLPGNVVARVAPMGHQTAQLELDLARSLVESGCPVGAPEPRVEPRVHERDGFAVTLWTYYEPVTGQVSPADYAEALTRLHAGLRGLEVEVPHFGDRVDQARQLVASDEETPALTDPDRELLGDALRELRRLIGERSGVEQLLHGEPHPGNVLATEDGLLFIDFETCCRGPIEFDLAHAPAGVKDHCPGVDRRLLWDCETLVLAMITTWRWDRADQFPDGRRLAGQWLGQLRARLVRPDRGAGG